MLQLLFPCSQYSPDKCLWCGGTFDNHLLLRWRRHLYTPFDLYVSRDYQQAVDSNAADTPGSQHHRQNNPTRSNNNIPGLDFGFHRRYVADVTYMLRQLEPNGPLPSHPWNFTTYSRRQWRHVQQGLSQHFSGVPLSQLEQRVVRVAASDRHPTEQLDRLVYVIPKMKKEVLESRPPLTILTVAIVREMFLSAVENLAQLEQVDRQCGRARLQSQHE
jgi:hypothetical protein